jgi:trigger factor
MDAKLAGTKPGDIVRFEDTLEPERFGEELAGPAEFLVMVKEVKELELPDEDDTFAKTASEFDSLQALRDDLRAKIAEAKERESVGVIRDRALQAVIDRVDVELPDSLIDDETAHRMRHAEDQASRYGLSLDQMLEIQGWDRDRLAEDNRQHALRSIKADLVLESVARTEEIDVTAEEIGTQIGTLAQAYDRDPKELAKQLDRSGQIVTLAGDIMRSKALDIIVDNADITEETPTPAEGDTTADDDEGEETA